MLYCNVAMVWVKLQGARKANASDSELHNKVAVKRHKMIRSVKS